MQLRLQFQSTQPKRAATKPASSLAQNDVISIHAAQEGCDYQAATATLIPSVFQSTQPKRAATIVNTTTSEGGAFQSTQPKRAATKPLSRRSSSDIYFNPRSPRGLRHCIYRPRPHCRYFNPRSPRGLRPTSSPSKTSGVRFQSTQPKRAATNTII